VASVLLQAGGHLEQPFRAQFRPSFRLAYRIQIRRQLHGDHLRPALGEGAGFVEQNGLQAGGYLDRIATAEQQAGASRQARSHGDGGGRGQAQGTGQATTSTAIAS